MLRYPLLAFVTPALVTLCSTIAAQQTKLSPVMNFPLASDSLVIRRHVEAGQPFTVAGPRGVLVGQQEGLFEAWILPVKLLSHFAIRAEVAGYPVPIDVNALPADIEVFPDHTTITHAHIAFTVRQIMFAPDAAPEGTGAVAIFQIDSVRPLDLTFSFTPEMRPMWPLPGQGVPSAEWVADPELASSGLYLLHTDFANLTGAVTMPGAQPGVMAPYQEKPQVHPVELKLHFDPKRDQGGYFPLLMAVGRTPETAAPAALQNRIGELSAAIPQIYKDHAAGYARLRSELTSIHTPDAGFDDAFAWAEMSIEQLRARSTYDGNIGLVAGYFSSGDSARPGFGWFFGRDALYTLYAVHGMGDFKLSRDALEFLIAQQRPDGKMMHEYSQTAPFLDWKALPYLYAAADSTPLFLTTMLDYVEASSDVEFLRKHRDAVERAWKFETTHDSDGDGIYDNVQGTGWVESWPGGMPHQEIYLALLDQQASAAMSRLARLLGDKTTEKDATARAAELGRKIEAEYYIPGSQSYAFSRNADGSLDKAATIYPTIAWWNSQPNLQWNSQPNSHSNSKPDSSANSSPTGGLGLKQPEASFRRWASHDFSTDWGLRDVAESDPVYDPISYHQGSVWPLFTGWAAIAEYRSGRALSGYAHLMHNADQTTAQDLGAVTELLSGALYIPFGRSTSHQLWSSAMVITPALRGLFGIKLDALSHTIYLNPHIPADWNHAEVRQLHIGDSVCTLEYARTPQGLAVHLHTVSGAPVTLKTDVDAARISAETAVATQTALFPLPPVEIAILHSLPPRGSRTTQMKVLAQTNGPHSLVLELEGPAGSISELGVRINRPDVRVTIDGASFGNERADGLRAATVRFAPGTGYQPHTVKFAW